MDDEEKKLLETISRIMSENLTMTLGVHSGNEDSVQALLRLVLREEKGNAKPDWVCDRIQELAESI
jgi:Asp-tRNA(Asn)/Glu-tRNA(Gln) amidotransferase B subunit